MDVDVPLPGNETTLLQTLLGLPYKKRTGYALRLVNAHRQDPALLSLIEELLSTTLLPDQVPLVGTEHDHGYITLLFPQSTASKRFFQRELGLAMASALGQPAIPLLLQAIIHPSTAGKSRAITACVSSSSGATDLQLVQAYQNSVPATQESLRIAMVAAGRVNALKVLQLWKEPPLVKIRDPRMVVLERDMKTAKPQERDTIWTRAGYVHLLTTSPRNCSPNASGTGYRFLDLIGISTILNMFGRAGQILSQPFLICSSYIPRRMSSPLHSNFLNTSHPSLPALTIAFSVFWCTIFHARSNLSGGPAIFLIRNTRGAICSNYRPVSCIRRKALGSGTCCLSRHNRSIYFPSFLS